MDAEQLTRAVEMLPSSERAQLEALGSYWWELAVALGASDRGIDWSRSWLLLAPELSRRAAAVAAPDLSTLLGYGSFSSLPRWEWEEILERYAAEPTVQRALVSLAAVYRDIDQNTTALRALVNDNAMRAWGRQRARRDEGTRRDNAPPPTGASGSGLAPLALAAGAGLLLARKGGTGGLLLPLLGAGAVWALSSGGRAPEGPPRRTVPGGSALPTPDAYARGKRRQLEARWRGGSEANPQGLGHWLERFVPQVLEFAEIPPVAFLGFTAIATGQTEVTSANEWGFFQTPGRSYERLAQSELVRQLLGRAADPTQWRSRPDEQTAVGLADLRAHYLALQGQGFSSSPGTVWRCALAFAGFSAGTGGVVQAWGAWRGQLEQTPEAQRFERLGGWIVERARTQALAPRSAHPNPAYTWLRTAQKLACGFQVADSLTAADRRNYGLAWFPTFPPDLQSNVAVAAAGLVPQGEITT